MVYKCNVPDNWTVEPGVFYLGNKFHPCAVLIPLDDELGMTILRHVADMGVAIAGFCKTANIGLEKVVCNILANPNIRYVVVAGHENPGHKSGKAIVMLHRYGVNPVTRRILCAPNEPCRDIPTGYLQNIPLEAIERFRRQVTVIDLIVDGKEVTDENVLELTCKVVSGTVQEPQRKIVLTIKGITYELFDPGAFDKKPYTITILDKFKLSSIDLPVSLLVIDNIENLKSTIYATFKSRKSVLNVNIIIPLSKERLSKHFFTTGSVIAFEENELYNTYTVQENSSKILIINFKKEVSLEHLENLVRKFLNYENLTILVLYCPILRLY